MMTEHPKSNSTTGVFFTGLMCQPVHPNNVVEGEQATFCILPLINVICEISFGPLAVGKSKRIRYIHTERKTSPSSPSSLNTSIICATSGKGGEPVS